MFESAEIGHKLKKSEYEREEPKLRQALLAAQFELLEKKKFPVVVLVNGVDGAGKGETVNLFNEWMDPRHIHTFAFGPANEIERARPPMWRYWQALPPKGKIGILFGSWYTDPILDRVMGHAKRAEFDAQLSRLRDFERMLAAEGALILKLWFHLSKKAQKKRLKTLSADPKTAWRVTPDDWAHFKHYDEFVSVCEHALRETSTGEAPWHVIEGSDAEYRSLTAGKLLSTSLRARLAGKAQPLSPAAPPPAPPIDARDVLTALDYTQKLKPATYDRKLDKAQGKLNLLTRDRKMRERSIVMVFEGMDAAGKGSTIRRITRALDARFYRIVPVAAPTEEERAQPYLWRFWRHIPPRGRAAIFDRSWYGRVLVERVENFCAEADWQRAYHEINEFEEQLAETGGIVVKFWLATTPQEQLRRFKEREKIAHKRFKITDEDWRNRKKWPLYKQAVADMVERTSTAEAPWHLIAADDKKFARVAVIETLCKALEKSFDR
ncbi:MAG: polyphosphate:AMP phosphotransferase [Gammaproteobacteria bacterium]|nr:polyphosphate:AMP phosphotransferase [Gammaproteobacteria bacterium]MBI5616455.1 polyphosphate:AMP phosphotransferase [Gammaproteobacteria bacterium]